ncbi:OB-fold protein [Gilliamella apicola]|uniref:Uncharacterized protein n=1 Tax=Gilliamella apicola TaxID=1196095 RepID=A0A2C9XY35_9GAMM|nr:hypothetical protein [Gilliamella apicola]OTP81447.1 hypothetical protein B5S40_11370 [Gilliamella apicola]OTP84406.1 hypothetical protein B5S44_10580 [Gilliamella apicola]OTP86452.1 hypothetical protein B5S42_13145 [Gilliamella apicola]OTP98215.1 hypothetical protein B6D08_11990 [Gilliamella apicola]OTQ08321.1 hypothetical protein B6C91_12780 [Gilliamella apicola]
MKNLIAVSILTLIGFSAFANDNAKRLTEMLINEDINIFKTAGDSIIGEKILIVSASDLNKEFSNDQTKYEKKYDNQLINIITQAPEVKTDLNGNPSIVINGDNQSELVSIELKNRDEALNIKKGSELDLICLGTKDNVKLPVLKDCVTADSYFQKFLEMKMNNISQLKEGDTPKDFFEAIYLSFKEFDIKNPNKLDGKKLDDNETDMDEILETVTDSIKEESKEFTMPNP